MTNYRRNFVPGGSYFFTVNLADRQLGLLTEHINSLRAAFRYAMSRHPFTIEAIVVLPDHLHAIWTMPERDSNFSLPWRLIKAATPHRSRKAPQGGPCRLRQKAPHLCQYRRRARNPLGGNESHRHIARLIAPFLCSTEATVSSSRPAAGMTPRAAAVNDGRRAALITRSALAG